MKSNESTLVYSSESGRITGGTKNSVTKSIKQKSIPLPADGIIRIRRETKGRGGGTVIVITGIPLAMPELKELAAVLKKRCGCGGTIKDGVIEIQGDHRELLQFELQAKGYRVKLAGG